MGVETIDERHVFSSFLSREAAYRLMFSLCPPTSPNESIIQGFQTDLEFGEERSFPDDSSESISGNESPSRPQDSSGTSTTEVGRMVYQQLMSSGINDLEERTKPSQNHIPGKKFTFEMKSTYFQKICSL